LYLKSREHDVASKPMKLITDRYIILVSLVLMNEAIISKEKAEKASIRTSHEKGSLLDLN
jgi:hypothetical protein